MPGPLVVSQERGITREYEIALPMTVRLIQEFLEGASAKSTLQRYFPASEPDMSWIRRRAERTAISKQAGPMYVGCSFKSFYPKTLVSFWAAGHIYIAKSDDGEN